MKKLIYIGFAFVCLINSAKAQTAVQFTGLDCNSNMVDLFADLNSGKAVVLEFYMPNCGSCPPPAQKIQAMGNKINQTYPGKVKGYAFPYQNSTTCSYSANWVNSNNLSSFWTPMDSGAYQVAYYGGFGMPTIVLLGGLDHRVMFSTLSFSASDTTIMRDSILALLGTTSMHDLSNEINSFEVFPNPADESVSIKIDLKNVTKVMVDVVDISGKQIAIISDEELSGMNTKLFDSSTLANGTYFIRININNKVITEKLTVQH